MEILFDSLASPVSSVASTTRGMSRKPMLRPRNASTAISFAALRMVGASPPARKQSGANLRHGNRAESGVSKGQLPHGRKIQTPRRRGNPPRPCQRMCDRRAHVGRGQMGQRGTILIGHQAMHNGLRMNDHAKAFSAGARIGNAPRSVRGPCSSGLRYRREIFVPIDQIGMGDRLLGRDVTPSFRSSIRETGRRKR